MSASAPPVSADVVLPVPVRGSYSYAVPEDFADLVVRGSVVAVPFRRRVMTGFVTATATQATRTDLKPIAEILLGGPALSEDLLAVAEFVADYYVAPLGEVLRTAVPVAKVNSRLRAAITAAGREAIAGSELRKADRALLEVLAQRGQLTAAAAGAAAGVRAVVDRLRRLETAGLVTQDARVTRSTGPSFEEILELTADVDVARRWAGARRAVVRLIELLAAGGPITYTQARRDANITRSQVTALAKSGHLTVARRAVERDRDVISRASQRLSRLDLTQRQIDAVSSVTTAIDKGGFAPMLLHGVTGAGKSLVYLACLEAVLNRGRTGILMVPEIALTPALGRELRGRFGDDVAVLHSGLRPGERHDAWQRVRDGRARVAFGARSAVFAPLPDLGLIIVDEEHDPSYKQGDRPRYNGRDVAVARANQLGIPILLGSATPSLESYTNTTNGRYQLLELPERIEGQRLPTVEVVDMRLEFERAGTDVLLSEPLELALKERLRRGEQSVLLLNRRGYSSFLLCRECGLRAECPNCSVTMTFHLRERVLKCHHCDYRQPPPEACAGCGGNFLNLVGHGTEKVEEALKRLVPQARIARLDRDATRGREQIEDVLSQVEAGAVDILVGTQMVAKGHDFPNVTLVGVVSVDAMLALPDFRATERAFALLTQVAGRAGRGDRPGHVLLQTFHPDNEAVKLACTQDYAGFFQRESQLRHLMSYPPSSHLLNLIVTASERERVRTDAAALAAALRKLAPRQVRVLGPAMAPVERRKGLYRAQLMVRSPQRTALRALLTSAADLLQEYFKRGVLDLDVDPLELM